MGDQVTVPVRKLANGTYAEDGSRSHSGNEPTQATFSGTVTYCADLEQPAAACDGSSATDHYVYAVSGLGVSAMVSAPHDQGAPPKVGSFVQVGVHIGAAFTPVTPASWATDGTCNPAYDEQHGNPAGPPHDSEPDPDFGQQQRHVDELESSRLSCRRTVPGPKLILSADDIRESGRDLAPLDVPSGFDTSKLSPGEAVQAALGVADDGTLSLKGITSDQGANGADDATQGQGSLAGR